MRYRYACPKRLDDLDSTGEIDRSVLIDYLQEARIEFLLSAPEPMAAMLDSGVLVADHRIEYLAPVGVREPVVDLELWVDQVGGARFAISYLLRDGDTEVARARTTAVAYDLAGGRLRRITPAEREQLSAAREPAVQLSALDPYPIGAGDPAHHSSCRVRWADLDSYGHLNNVRFFDYFAQARAEMIMDALNVGPAQTDRWRVVRQDVGYTLPVDFRREPYLIRTVITGIDKTGVAVAAELVGSADDHDCYARSRAVLVRTGADGRAEPITDDTRTALLAFGS